MSTETEGKPSHPYRSFLAAAVLVVLGLLLTAGLKSYRDLARAHDREADLERQIEETQLRIDQLRGHIERLEVDPATLERLAREELGMVRPGDVVIVLPAVGGAVGEPHNGRGPARGPARAQGRPGSEGPDLAP